MTQVLALIIVKNLTTIICSAKPNIVEPKVRNKIIQTKIYWRIIGQNTELSHIIYVRWDVMISGMLFTF